MNKTAIKNFAVWARNKLIAEIKYKAGLLGINENSIAAELPASTDNLKFYEIGTKEPAKVEGIAIRQRKSLVDAINNKATELKYKEAFEYVVEEVAYTWFNRLIAIRFMEVNGYIPSGIRVLSSDMTGKNEPDMVSSPFETDMEFSSAEREFMNKLKDDELFRFLFIKQCNKLNDVLPELFEKTDNYTELLLTLSFTDTDSVVYHLVHDIPEDDFNVEKEGQVQIIGWLYQYYNTDQNELVYDGSMSKVRIPKELISAATTIYTPDWSVRYMVENSLGRLWSEGHQNFDKSKWIYYLYEAEQDECIKAQLEELRTEYKNISPEDIKLIDPCMGSGHILVYAFDVLMQIYLSQGYTERDAAVKIIENNIFGADIDKRAYQLSYFALMMKGRASDRRFLTRGVKPNLCNFQELDVINTANLNGILVDFAKQFINADTYGSLLETQKFDINELAALIDEFEEDIFTYGYREILSKMLTVYRILSQKYDVVVTNPPYLGSSRFPSALLDYVNNNFSEEKTDLSMAMLRKSIDTFAKANGFVAYITTSSWFFLSSFEKMRSYIINNYQFDSIVDYGTELFDGKVGHNPIVSWVTQKVKPYRPIKAVRLVDYCYSRRDEKEPEFFNAKNHYTAKQENFSKIPGSPVAYWVSENFIRAFENGKIENISEVITGMTIGDNNKYLRLWFEVKKSGIAFNKKSMSEIDLRFEKWIPYSKGGQRRNWYGNYEYIVNWSQKENFNRSKTTLQHLYLKEALTWPFITSGDFSARFLPFGFLWDVAGSPCFFNDITIQNYTLGFLCTKLCNMILNIINPTINVQALDISRIPIILSKPYKPKIETLVEENISLSKTDWDSFETSWDFEKHPLVNLVPEGGYGENSDNWGYKIRASYNLWQIDCSERFNTLKQNEEELNRIFIEIYGLQDELTPEVEDKDVTVRKADLTRDIKSFVSYAVGCMFGRYSLDVDGLVYAGGEWDNSKYITYIPDDDNCIPITDEEYFGDDIVGRFVEFVKTVYGEQTLEENLDFIAQALSNKGNTSRQIIRNYFLTDFIKDHNKIYQKRPIYWMFDSGKQNGFKALIYMHRWNADTTGNVRVEYLHKLQRVYESEINRMQETIDNSTNSRDITLAEKRKDKLIKQLKEARDYDEKISHLALARIDIDLDDGVKVNYEKVQTAQDGKKLEVLVPIK